MSVSPSTPLSLVVLISGEGSNLQAIIDSIAAHSLHAIIKAVISNRATAPGLARAQHAKIPTHILDAKNYSQRIDYDRALIKLIDQYQPHLVVLAGFMRILSDELVNHYHGRLINIHPSLLPKFKGLNTHQRVLDAGESEHGATVHFVEPELDSGPIIMQAKILVHATDTANSLQQRVHKIEHQLYPAAIQLIASGRVQLRDNTVYIDGKRNG